MRSLYFLIITGLINIQIIGQQIHISDEVRMLAMGDSYTIGESVEQNERWPHQFINGLRKLGIQVDDPDYIATTGWTTRDLIKGMAENLKTGNYADGSGIPYVEDTLIWQAQGFYGEAYCWYDNDISLGEEYGALYTWRAAMKRETSSNSIPSGIQGVCPDGWHLPSDEEWKLLEIYLGMSPGEADGEGTRGTTEGDKLKESGYAHWGSSNTGTNESGFTGLPGGYRRYNGYVFFGSEGRWWTSTEESPFDAWSRVLSAGHSGISRFSNVTNQGYSVRCVRD